MPGPAGRWGNSSPRLGTALVVVTKLLDGLELITNGTPARNTTIIMRSR
jgi:hypothetical protein